MAIWGLYHSDCLDGFGAAFALWLYYKKRYAHLPSPPSLSFMPVKYGEAFPAEPEPGDVIYILDFSFPREVLELHAQDKKIVVIDHHKTAAENLRRLPSSPIPLSPTGIVAHFDMNKSGAVMAWEYFFPDEPVPMLLQHIQDRDLWRFEIPGTRELTEALFYRPRTLPEWEKLLAPKAMEELRKEANVLYSAKIERIQRAVKEVWNITLAGQSIPAVNATTDISEIAEALYTRFPEAPFVAVYYITGTGEIKFSLRSHSLGVDVSEVAQQYGGGGHKHAAGFSLPLTGYLFDTLTELSPTAQEQVDYNFKTYWQGVVCDPVTGELVTEAVKRELSDYSVVIGEVSKAYDILTGGRFSKPNTAHEYIVERVTEHFDEEREEAIREALRERTGELEKFHEERIKALEGICEEALKDAKRLSWLETKAGGQYRSWVCKPSTLGRGYRLQAVRQMDGLIYDFETHNSARAAIDHAMSEGVKGVTSQQIRNMINGLSVPYDIHQSALRKIDFLRAKLARLELITSKNESTHQPYCVDKCSDENLAKAILKALKIHAHPKATINPKGENVSLFVYLPQRPDGRSYDIPLIKSYFPMGAVDISCASFQIRLNERWGIDAERIEDVKDYLANLGWRAEVVSTVAQGKMLDRHISEKNGRMEWI
jgi:nanoRNase/pAp phosphatase (c-di-AMP/oligoRNAs hydrolase)